MGFLRDLGKFAGKATGTIVGGTVNVVGEVTGSKFIQDVGDGVKKASEFAGDTVGQIADGAWNTASGIIQDDKNKIDDGINNIGDSIGRTAKGVYHTAKNTYHSGKSTYEGFRDGDDLKVKQGLRDIAKTAAIGTLAVGVIDLVDGVDGVENNKENASTEHNVKPHEVSGYHRADGTYVEGYYRDGDGNPETRLTKEQGGGYIRSNPEFINTDNLDNNSNLQTVEMNNHQADPSSTASVHDVKPHQVSGYYRTDGTYVESYYRDGDGNPETQLTEKQGGGYFRSNPDGNPHNNLNS